MSGIRVWNWFWSQQNRLVLMFDTNSDSKTSFQRSCVSIRSDKKYKLHFVLFSIVNEKLLVSRCRKQICPSAAKKDPTATNSLVWRRYSACTWTCKIDYWVCRAGNIKWRRSNNLRVPLQAMRVQVFNHFCGFLVIYLSSKNSIFGLGQVIYSSEWNNS